MKYTIKDIAQLCGVGKSTVSRVLNDDPNVRSETRVKVQAVIDQLGFQPNRSARAMRGIMDRVVGIIVTRLNSPAESQTLSAILHELHQQNITPMIVESQFQPEQVERDLHIFRKRQVDGVIVFGFSQLSEQILNQWKGSIVAIARPYAHISSVVYDDETAVKSLMDHFYQQGHRHIAYLGINDSDETTGKRRNQSYRDFCQQHRLQANLATGNLGAESGYQNVAKLFEQPVDALICASSSLAIGALKFLQESGQNRPLACIGNNELLQYLVPDLVSLDFGYKQAGKWAVELLNKQFDGNKEREHRCVAVKSMR